MMPGGFGQAPQAPVFNPLLNADAMEVVDQEHIIDFSNKQKVSRKTQRQAQIISQLDVLVYMLAGYQLVKYCHLACLLPLVGHVMVQKLLCCERFSNGSGLETRDFLTLLNDLDRSRLEGGADRLESIYKIANRVCAAVYWKGIASILYHIGFVCFWLVPLAETGQILVIGNGSWWFVSFIGESTIIDSNFQDLAYITKLMDLGLLGLLVSDFCILGLQLVLYQAIFRQSTVSPLGRTLLELEIEVLRVGGGGDGDQLDESTFEPPLTFVVKLFETFKTSAFLPHSEVD